MTGTKSVSFKMNADGQAKFAGMISALQGSNSEWYLESHDDLVTIVFGKKEKQPSQVQELLERAEAESEEQHERRRRWIDVEWVVVRELYSIFGGPYPPSQHFHHPKIQSVARALNRSNQSIYLRLSNIGACEGKASGFKPNDVAKKYLELPVNDEGEYRRLLAKAVDQFGGGDYKSIFGQEKE